MKKLIHYFILLFISGNIFAQQTGDTIVVKGFKYGSNTRDTVINFPSGNTTYEKIILKYNMRCKNNLVSTQAAPNQGCGEWDYSCNTYIVDSSKIENALFTNPNYMVSNFTGSVFPYTSQALYDYYNFSQTSVTLNSVVSENQYTLGNGSNAMSNVIKPNVKSGRTMVLFTAAELSAAGLTAGNINGLMLNVSGSGASVNFLKIGIQQTTLTALNANTVAVSGYSTYYHSNYTFTTGVNRIQFPAPAFVWNGSSNLLLDISYTNTNPNNPLFISGTNTSSVMTLFANNNYALDLSALGHVILNAPSLSNISNEMTVSFWAYGNAALLPNNTSILYGYDSNPNNRNFNLHLPWSNSNMYFDCGFANGGYDRINKAAVPAEISGQWNHWAFTKNAVSGDMKIYLNGFLWHSGTAMTKTISILTMILGKDNALQNNWKGKINELSIWNKELSQSDIQAWMNKQINNTHPFYTNLMAYYKLDEGTGQVVTDSKNNLTSTGVNLQWTYDRGTNLFKSFTESSSRPNVVFLRGTYNLTTATVTVKDSIRRNANVVQQYSITSNAGISPMTDDQVVLVSTQNLYQASPIYTYNGDTGVLTGTTAVNNFSVLNITDLPYYKRYPYFNEIMSFVTPYGKGLSLGANGKSWYYDVSDFAPILKGKKRLLMTLGGENQEQMDLDFWFIVGTPPRTVLQYDQLWQGAARAGGAAIASINNDTRFPVLTQSILPTAQSFKLRSTITGHGAQGEFSQNGGTIYHNFNIAGGAPEFTWQITQKCSDNPMIAQGGTWVYPRQGWCPGQASLLKEFNLTPFISPGNTVTLDYGCSNPPNITGDYRYIVANQFISYGAMNKTLDAAVIDVLQPSDKFLYSKFNPICSNPVIVARNTGSTTLTGMTIDYWINNASAKETYTWTGSLASMDTAIIVLPLGNLWKAPTLSSGNKFNVDIKKANAAVDQYTYNNVYHSAFELPISISNSFTIVFKTNNYPSEDTYTLTDDVGNLIAVSSLTAANTVFNDYYELIGCFKLKVEDVGGDGVQWWANAAQGTGYIQLKDAAGNIVKTFNPDFGNGFEFSFTTYDASNLVGLQDNGLTYAVNIYPNPAHDKFILQGNIPDGAEIKITNMLGQMFEVPSTKTAIGFEFDAGKLKPGVYVVSISKDNRTSIKKIVIQ